MTVQINGSACVDGERCSWVYLVEQYTVGGPLGTTAAYTADPLARMWGLLCSVPTISSPHTHVWGTEILFISASYHIVTCHL